MSNQRLAQKHAFITGANGGIGSAIAQAFLAHGATCTLADIHPQPSNVLQSVITNYANTACYFQTDVTSLLQVESALDYAKQHFGPLTTLVNNAAIFDMAPLLQSDDDMYDRIFSVNVKGAFFVMQKVLAQMQQHNIAGSIINMASQAGRRGEALVCHYCASKAAIISYTQSAALAMASHNIRVNALSPGVIDTPLWEDVDRLFARYEGHNLGEKKRLVGEAVPLGYMGKPQDVCGIAVFLASNESSYITAQTINVDGGSVMS